LIQENGLVSSNVTFEHYSREHQRTPQWSTRRTFHPHPPVPLILLNSQRKTLTMDQFAVCLGCSERRAV